MHGACAWPVDNSITREANAAAQIEVLAVEEETLVEATVGVLQGRPPQEKEGRSTAVDVVRRIRVHEGEVVATAESTVWKHGLQTDELGERREQRRVGAPAGGIDLVVGQ